MGHDIEEILQEIADTLADVIYFILPYKKFLVISLAEEELNKNENLEGSVEKNLEVIKRKVQSIKEDENDGQQILKLLFPILVGLDQLIRDNLNNYLNNSSVALLDSNYLQIRNGLNSDISRKKNNIMILPRWKTMWEGSGEDREINSDSFNRILKFSRYVILEKGLVKGKYSVNCIFMNDQDALNGGALIKGVNSLIVGVSPMSDKFVLKKFPVSANSVLYNIESWNKDTKSEIKNIVLKVIKRAEELKVNLLVFPEMLGYKGLEKEIADVIYDEEYIFLKLIVLPSIWEPGENGGKNYSYIIHGSRGDAVLRQGKLVRYSKGTVVENIVEDSIINLLYDKIHGCIGVLICKSAIEEELRELFVKDLGVKILICPSWSEKSHQFFKAAMGNEIWNANSIWVNSCSAIPKDEKYGYEPVCIVTNYCKKAGVGDLNPSEFFPCLSSEEKNCLEDGSACVFVTEIKGYVE